MSPCGLDHWEPPNETGMAFASFPVFYPLHHHLIFSLEGMCSLVWGGEASYSQSLLAVLLWNILLLIYARIFVCSLFAFCLLLHVKEWLSGNTQGSTQFAYTDIPLLEWKYTQAP